MGVRLLPGTHRISNPQSNALGIFDILGTGRRRKAKADEVRPNNVRSAAEPGQEPLNECEPKAKHEFSELTPTPPGDT